MAIPGKLNAAEIPYISSEPEFTAVCKLPKAIIYIQINRSEQERQSRQVFHEALQHINLGDVQAYKIDCTDQQLDYFENWLIAQREHVHLFYTGGYGEILFVQHGEVTDFINYPGKAGAEITAAKITGWL